MRRNAAPAIPRTYYLISMFYLFFVRQIYVRRLDIRSKKPKSLVVMGFSGMFNLRIEVSTFWRLCFLRIFHGNDSPEAPSQG